MKRTDDGFKAEIESILKCYLFMPHVKQTMELVVQALNEKKFLDIDGSELIWECDFNDGKNTKIKTTFKDGEEFNVGIGG